MRSRVEVADEQLAWEVRQLATILERMPALDARALPCAGRSPDSARRTRAWSQSIEGLEACSSRWPPRRCSGSARTAYSHRPEITERTQWSLRQRRQRHRDPTLELPDRPGVILALLRCERALAAMYAVNVERRRGELPS